MLLSAIEASHAGWLQPGLGRGVHVIATGAVEIDAGKLTVEPRSIDLGGPDFLSDATGAVVRRLVTLEHDIGVLR